MSNSSIAATMMPIADTSEMPRYGSVLPTTYDTVLMGAIRTCSHVPRSFSLTTERAVEIVPVIIPMNPISPGTRKSVLRSSGLNQMRGSIADRRREVQSALLDDEAGRDAPHDRHGVAHHGGRRVGVVAVDDHLHRRRLAAPDQRGRCSRG